MSDELFPVEREILDALNKKAGELWERKRGGEQIGDGEWTSEFAAVLKSVGEGRGMTVYHSGGEKRGWLWDLCWLSEGQSWQDFRGVKLACEIEWGPVGRRDEWDHYKRFILGDFLKLVVADAEFRLFVFGIKNCNDLEKTFDLLMNACPASKGHRYLAICFPDDGKTRVPPRAWTL